MRRFISSLILIPFLFLGAGLGYAETWSMRAQIDSSNGGYVEIQGILSCDLSKCNNYDFWNCPYTINTTYIYHNFLAPFFNSLVTIDGTYYDTYVNGTYDETGYETITGNGTIVIGDIRYTIAIDMIITDNLDYSGTIVVNGITYPIDESLGELIEDIFVSW